MTLDATDIRILCISWKRGEAQPPKQIVAGEAKPREKIYARQYFTPTMNNETAASIIIRYQQR